HRRWNRTSLPAAITNHPSIAPFDVFRASDGWFVIAAGNDVLFQRLCATLELPAVAADPRFATNPLRCTHHEALKAALEARLAAADCEHWQDLLMRDNIPTGAYNNVAEVLQDPQVQSRDMLLQLKAQSGRDLTVAGNPIHIGDHRTLLHRQPPRLDQDRERILASLRALQD
ncbi:MAG: CoA transferase, partial [Comamonadaceae bacterium]